MDLSPKYEKKQEGEFSYPVIRDGDGGETISQETKWKRRFDSFTNPQPANRGVRHGSTTPDLALLCTDESRLQSRTARRSRNLATVSPDRCHPVTRNYRGKASCLRTYGWYKTCIVDRIHGGPRAGGLVPMYALPYEPCK